jgi:hypothetical protein
LNQFSLSLLYAAWQMSKLKHLIHKVASATSSRRESIKSTDNGEASGHQNVVGFAETNGGPHPPNGTDRHDHGRRRNRSLSLTDEKILRSEVREAADEKEKRKRDDEKKKAYDEVCPPHHPLCIAPY